MSPEEMRAMKAQTVSTDSYKKMEAKRKARIEELKQEGKENRQVLKAAKDLQRVGKALRAKADGTEAQKAVTDVNKKKAEEKGKDEVHKTSQKSVEKTAKVATKVPAKAAPASSQPSKAPTLAEPKDEKKKRQKAAEMGADEVHKTSQKP